MKNDLSRLKSQLLTSGLQVKDNPLFQVIDQLIRTVESLNKEVIGVTTINTSNVINNERFNGLTIPLTGNGNEFEYSDNPYPSLGGEIIQQITNITNNNNNNASFSTEVNSDEYFDNPYLSLNSGIVQNVITTNNNNIINNLLLMNEYIDKEYADDPYPSLGTALPLIGSNPNITNDNTTNADMFPTWVTASSGVLPLKVSDSGFLFNPAQSKVFTGSLLLTGTLDVTGATTIGTGFLAQAKLDIKDTSATRYALKVFQDNATDSFGLLINAGIDVNDYAIRAKNRADTTDLFLVRGDGTVDIAGLLTLSAGQIKFPATQNASTDANTLDDYEEGTWTPTDTSGAVLTFTSVSAAYIKIGQLVIAAFELTYPSTASGLAAKIGSLPFTTFGTPTNGWAGMVGYTNSNIDFRFITLGTNLFPYKIDGAQPTNANLSLFVVRGNAIYRASA